MTGATLRQCAVLMGATLLPCGDRPFLAWLLREFVRYGVSDVLLLTGRMSAEIERAAETIRAGLPRSVDIALSEAPAHAGTGGAVFHARGRLHERFLLCNGDSLLDGGLSPLLAAACRDGPDVIGRMLLRRSDDASGGGGVALDGDRVTGFPARPPSGSPGMAIGGVCAFNRRLIDELTPSCSLAAETMPRLAARGALRGVIGDGYFCDIGVPGDLARAQHEIPARLRRKALFLDRDGVINLDHGYVGTRDRFEWVDGAREAVALATRAGWQVFIVTNQSGVARGFYTEADVSALLAWIGDECRAVGGTIDDVRYCPFHAEAVVDAYRTVSDWRKPEPGMLLDLIRAWELNPERCVMIGDQPADMQAAARAGMQGFLFPGGNLLEFVRALLAGFADAPLSPVVRATGRV